MAIYDLTKQEVVEFLAEFEEKLPNMGIALYEKSFDFKSSDLGYDMMIIIILENYIKKDMKAKLSKKIKKPSKSMQIQYIYVSSPLVLR